MAEPIAVRVNGKAEDGLPATDRGLHFGDGVFETVAVVEGRPRHLDRHLERLLAGAERLGIRPPERGRLAGEARELAGAADRAVLKIMVTAGSGGRGYARPGAGAARRIMILNPWRGRPAEEYRHGATIRWCTQRLGINPALAGIKHLNRLEQVLARREWREPDTAEGLMLDTEGRVIEGTASNLFLVAGDRLLTPDLSRCGVEGIMRGLVMELAAGLDRQARVEDLSPADLADAGELFLTSSLLGILPVARLEDREWPVGPVTRELMERLDSDD